MFKPLLIFTLFISLVLSANDYADLNQAVFTAHNRARTDPDYFAQMAEDERQLFIYDSSGNPTDQICLSDGFVAQSTTCSYRLNTQEGMPAWTEAVTYLQDFSTTLSGLTWSEGLSQACYDHISDTGPTGTVSHSGSDGSSSSDRIDRYVTWTRNGENLSFSNVKDGYDVILQLLIDDGVSSRGHRNSIMSENFSHMGVSCGCHTSYTEMCCIAYGNNVVEKDSSLTADVAPQLST